MKIWLCKENMDIDHDFKNKPAESATWNKTFLSVDCKPNKSSSLAAAAVSGTRSVHSWSTQDLLLIFD
jgi:hypothetical protein